MKVLPVIRLVFVLVIAAVAARGLSAQPPALDPWRAVVTRGALDSLLREFEAAAASSTYGPALRERARVRAAQIRARLRDGDFQVGDRVSLRVEGETTLTDTFTVQTGRLLDLPGIGRIPLAGTLRSELRDTLQRRLGAFLRQPEVRALPLIRIAVIGEVRSQGFYTVPVDLLVEDLIQAAGGPTAGADLGRIEFEREGEVVWDGRDVQRAITIGMTLDALNIQSGDRMEVGVRPRRNWDTIVRTTSIILTIPVTIYGLIRLFF